MLGVLGSSGCWQQEEGGKERSGGGQHPRQAQPQAEPCPQSLTRLSPGGAGLGGAGPGSTAAPTSCPRHQTGTGCFPGSPHPGDPAAGTAQCCHPRGTAVPSSGTHRRGAEEAVPQLPTTSLGCGTWWHWHQPRAQTRHRPPGPCLPCAHTPRAQAPVPPVLPARLGHPGVSQRAPRPHHLWTGLGYARTPCAHPAAWHWCPRCCRGRPP